MFAKLQRAISARLGAKITIFSLGSMIVAMVVTISAVCLVGARAMQRDAEARLMVMAVAAGDAVMRWYGQSGLLLDYLASQPAFVSMDGAAQKTYLAAVPKTYGEIFLTMTTDPSGRNLARSDEKPLIDYKDRVYIKEPAAGKGTTTETVISKTTGNPAVAIGRAIMGEGARVNGVVALVTEIASLSKAVGAVRIGSTGFAYLVDGKNQIVAHPDDQLAKKLTRIDGQPQIAALRQQHRGLVNITSTEDGLGAAGGEPVSWVAYVSELPNGWGLIIQQRQSEILAGVVSYVTTAAAFLVGMVLLVGFLSQRIIGRLLSPLAKLKDGAARFGRGEWSERVAVTTRDEIGVLGETFNHMADAIRTYQSDLEAKIKARTAELSRREGAMRLILNNAGDGFVTFAANGVLEEERSAAIDAWFGGPAPKSTFQQHVLPADERMRQQFEAMLEQIFDVPEAAFLSIDQLPSAFARDSRHFRVNYRLITEGDVPVKVLAIVSDVTAEVERQKQEQERLELVRVIEWVLKDKGGFFDFLAAGERIVAPLRTNPLPEAKAVTAAIHTLKGNCAVFGFVLIADACHRLEGELMTGLRSQRELVPALVQLWDERVRRVTALFAGKADGQHIEVPVEDLTTLLSQLHDGIAVEEAARILESWTHEPVARRLWRLSEAAKSTARRLGKENVLVQVEDHGIRVASGVMDEVWAELLHLVRNAVDHGAESPTERAKLGKVPEFTLTITTEAASDHLRITFTDDGRGIDLDRVREKAKTLGLAHATSRDLMEALFADGFSTKDAATDISGRGVGLGAVRASLRAHGGDVTVTTVLGKGTTFVAEYPLGGKAGSVAKAA